jgi:transposase-like protein
MQKKSNKTIIRIRTDLLKQGHSVRSWARKHDYTQQAVSYAIHKWSSRNKGMPKGKTRRILFDLSLSLGWYVCPGLKT